MNVSVIAPRHLPTDAVVNLPSSKSISNRLLILDALTGFNSRVTNLSDANDTEVLQRMLKQRDGVLDAEDAGTVLRFAAVYFSLHDGEHTITGTERLMNRPTQPLLDALRCLGGYAAFKKVDGEKSLVIRGGRLKGGEAAVDASESSQFVSALLLCGAAMPNGLVVKMKGNVVSGPYIDMTLGLMDAIGIEFSVTSKSIVVPHQAVRPFRLKVETDWSSAAFFYSLLACYDSGKMLLKGLSVDSLQGDSVVMNLMEAFGVTTKSLGDGIEIEKRKVKLPKSITFDANEFPDLVPALAVAALCNNIRITFKGVGHLQLKESNRIDALVTGATQLGAIAKRLDSSRFSIEPKKRFVGNARVESFADHRIAMAFSLASTRYGKIVIDNADVVKKSFPRYWGELRRLGFDVRHSVARK